MILQGIFPIVNTILYLKHKYPLKGMEVKSFILSAPEIWLQIPTAIFTLFFVGKSIEISIDNTCHGNESWTFGVFAIILAWTNLTLILYKFPVIGHYALVFAAICWTFFQLMFFAIFLLLASTVVLHMIFYNPLAPVSHFLLYIALLEIIIIILLLLLVLTIFQFWGWCCHGNIHDNRRLWLPRQFWFVFQSRVYQRL